MSADSPADASQPRFGIDVGGTAIKAGAIRPDGTILAHDSWPTHAGGAESAEALFDRLALIARALDQRVAGSGPPGGQVGIGVPGLVDAEGGRVETSPNLPELAGARLAEEVAARLQLPPEDVLVGNDANVAALGEAWLGAMAGVDHGLMITLGTGVGGGLVLGGRPFLGAGMAGEPGHLVIEPDGLTCPCGSRGCLETLASATAAERRARELGLPVGSPGDVVRLTELALAGRGPEADLCYAIGRDLGHGLALVVTLLDVRTFVIGGGFSAAFDALLPGIRTGLAERTFGQRVAAIRILRATLGPEAGWIGAARLALLA